MAALVSYALLIQAFAVAATARSFTPAPDMVFCTGMPIVAISGERALMPSSGEDQQDACCGNCIGAPRFELVVPELAMLPAPRIASATLSCPLSVDVFERAWVLSGTARGPPVA